MRIRNFALAAVVALGVPSMTAISSAQAAVPTCFGQTVTVMGTPGDDTLIGSGDVAEVIYGGGGNDLIVGGEFYEGGSAPDFLCGGPGDDRVLGSPGADRLSGGEGNDYVDGGNGADVEHGNGGDDRLGAGSFADADSANDVMRGGSGNDTLVGGWGMDQMYGEAGADSLYDLECDGPTLLNGGGGDDYLESWSSSFDGYGANVCSSVADRVVGGTGVDTAVVDALDAVSTTENVTLKSP